MTPADVIGTASDANLLRYTLELSRKDSNEFFQIGTGDVSVTNGLLGALDPTTQRNGLYDLRLTAEDASGNVASVTRTVQFEGEANVGNFTISFDDLEIPVPVGMITDRDIVVGPVAQATERISALTVGDVMTTPAITVREAESLDSALTKMARQGVRRVPVVGPTGTVTGVLALDDVLGHVTGELGKVVSLLAHEAEREVERRPSEEQGHDHAGTAVQP